MAVDYSFELALAQAIAWCAPRADVDDPAGSLRSSQLRPPMLLDRRLGVWILVDVRNSYSDTETNVAQPVQSAEDLQGGRLLVYFPDEDLSDGVAEAESGGFFDGYNAPPWDTWVALLGDDYGGPKIALLGDDLDSRPHLVSWVPPSFLGLAAAGIRANAEECVRWLEDTDVPLVALLRERGVIT
jgi:hypothetical protein